MYVTHNDLCEQNCNFLGSACSDSSNTSDYETSMFNRTFQENWNKVTATLFLVIKINECTY